MALSTVSKGSARAAAAHAALRLVFLSLLAACAAPGPVLVRHLPPDAERVELAGTPFFPQERYQCGPAALATALRASGVPVEPKALVDKVYIPALKGSLQAEMLAAARGFRRVPYVIEPQLSALLRELQEGRPVLVLENRGWRILPVWHYAVVIGYLPARDALVLRSGTERRRIVGAADFADNWRKAKRWGVVLLRPGELPAGDSAHRYLRAVAGLEASDANEAAASAYAAATERWPREPAAWLGLGNAHYALDDPAVAEAAYRRALTMAPDVAVARNNLAQILAERGCMDAARREIDRALADAPPELKAPIRATRDEIRAMPEGKCGKRGARRSSRAPGP